jgi:hypothetical protein
MPRKKSRLASRPTTPTVFLPSPFRRTAYVAHQGAGTLSTYDLSAASLIQPGDGNTVTFSARIEVGHAPQGIVVSADGTRAYIANFLSRNIQVLGLTNPSAPMIISTVSVAAGTLLPRIANGKRLFYRSKEPAHSRANYIACVSCHADGGGHDGRTWDFTHKGEGLRNTTDLRSRGGVAHGPVHWSANFDEIQDFENDIVNAFGGTGLAQDGQPPPAVNGSAPRCLASTRLRCSALGLRAPPARWQRGNIARRAHHSKQQRPARNHLVAHDQSAFRSGRISSVHRWQRKRRAGGSRRRRHSDSWERRFGLDPQNAADAALDSDNDGATNLAEFLAGTDPLEPNSRLQIHDAVRANNSVTFRFSTAPQRSYVAEFIATLASTNWLPLATIPGDGAEKVVNDTNAGGLQRFYRARVAP